MLTQIMSYSFVSIVILLGVLVFIHEFGHFLVAKLCKVGVETFSIGFGPVIISFKAAGTLYQIAAIPLGGYVKLAGAMPGEEVPKEYEGKELSKATPFQKFLILLAGPAFNIFLAIFIYMSMSLVGLKKVESVVGLVRKGSPAQEAGLLPGDKLLKLGDVKVETWDEMSRLISKSPGQALDVSFQRAETVKTVSIVPDIFKVDSHRGGKEDVGRIGIAPLFWLPIVSVSQKSQAYEAGFRTGDQIKSYEIVYGDGKPTFSGEISAFHEFERLLSGSNKLVGAQVLTFLVERESKELSLAFPLEEKSSLNLNSFGFYSSEMTFLKEESSLFHPGLKNHDRLLVFEGVVVRDVFALEEILRENKKETVELTVSRDGVSKTFEVKLESIERQMPSGKETFYTFKTPFLAKAKSLPTKVEKADSILSAFVYGLTKTWDMTVMITESLWGLVRGNVPLATIGGPIAIAKVASDSAKMGLEVFFFMMAIISINLAIVNLLPIPILDGGRIVLVFIEWIKGGPLSLEATENFQKLGFVFIFSLFVLAMYNDISRFWASMIKDVLGLFG